MRATHTAGAYLKIDPESPIFLRGDAIYSELIHLRSQPFRHSSARAAYSPRGDGRLERPLPGREDPAAPRRPDHVQGGQAVRYTCQLLGWLRSV